MRRTLPQMWKWSRMDTFGAFYGPCNICVAPWGLTGSSCITMTHGRDQSISTGTILRLHCLHIPPQLLNQLRNQQSEL